MGVKTVQRAVLEVTHSGEKAGREVFTEILDLRDAFARAGITLREARRGKPGQVRITVGPGAERAALRVLDHLATQANQNVGRRDSAHIGIALDLPAEDLHLEIPRQAREARRHLLAAAADAPHPVPAAPPFPAFAMS